MFVDNIAISQAQLKTVAAHKHDGWEIILNLHGRGVNDVGGVIMDFDPGTIVICPPDTFHCKRTHAGYFQDIYISFSGVCGFAKEENICMQDDADKTIEKLMIIAHTLYQKKEAGYQDVVNSLTEDICNILLGWRQGSDEDPKIALLQNEIIRNFTNPDFTVEDAMRRMNYCRDYLCRCFKKKAGQTPVEYLNAIRIQHAMKLFSQHTYPKRSVGEVAYLSGYHDAGYFSRVFRKLQGVSPKAYQDILWQEPSQGIRLI